MTTPSLFSSLQLGDLELANRVVMAPMTRSRATAGDMPTPVMEAYYQQRASAGLIISEGISPSADGTGYCRTPGLYTAEQTEAWARIVAGVHARGGKIVAQLMHCGRVASRFNKSASARTVAPSAIAAATSLYTDSEGMAPCDDPHALTVDEVGAVIDDYRRAAENAYRAGFDGVELHCTSGYLPAQFLSTGSNQRDDEYGGSVDNRVRFPVQVLRALAEVGGAGRVGFRICPDNPFNDLADDNPQETFEVFLQQAAQLDLAYVHAIRFPKGRVDNLALARAYFGDRLIANESFDQGEAEAAIAAGSVAAVSFGRAFIANPDLVHRMQQGLELAQFNLDTLYTPGEVGYADYPVA